MNHRIALAGNPNCGKTTLFNALTGSSQYVGNWPGVTVEKVEGRLKSNKEIILTDLPGIYSLSPYSDDEVVSRRFLLRERPDMIINIIDSSNPERNLYLTTQLQELGIPMILALNMTDVIRKNGDFIDTKKLTHRFGCPAVEISALKGSGLKELSQAVEKMLFDKTPPKPVSFSPATEKALKEIENTAGGIIPAEGSRWMTVKLLERDSEILDLLKADAGQRKIMSEITQSLEKKGNDDIESLISAERYEAVEHLLHDCYRRKRPDVTVSDKIDRYVTNRWFAFPIFAAVMFLVYFISVTTVGAVATDWTNDVLLGEWIKPGVRTLLISAGAAPWITSLTVDGIIGGVGAVLGFLPQMFILFLFLSFLEDCGYMTRVAFIMNRLFKRFGLSGKSFIPLLIASGCGVPGIMATKTIENESSRRITILTATFIPCGAKLPVIALISGAALGGAWWAAPAVYFTGIAAVACTGIILKKTAPFQGSSAPFVMELPAYHLPAFRNLFFHVWERCRSFVIKAGTVIFLACTLIWFFSSFGIDRTGFGMVSVENSFLAWIGSAIAPLFKPVGFGSWEAAVATVTGLAAKENIVGTLGVLLNRGITEEVNPGFTAAVINLFPSKAGALSFLIFNILCAPCVAAIGAMARQMGSPKWTLFALSYQTLFAYAVSLLIFQFGNLITGNGFSAGTVFALSVLAGFLYALFRRPDTGKRLFTGRKK